jgi:hypothetical protein
MEKVILPSITSAIKKTLMVLIDEVYSEKKWKNRAFPFILPAI